MLSVNNLRVTYGNILALDNFSLNVDKGKIYSLIGPSGCGKTTLLKVLCGIQTNYTGSLFREGQQIEPSDIGIGYVPQQYGLLDWKTVKQNIFLPYNLDKSKTKDNKEIDEIINALEIKELLDRYPNQLSGGQKQRVALARAFVSQPNLLLMDEPFSSLDAFTAAEAQRVFLKLWERYQLTTLFITHNIHEAIAVGHRIVLMSKTASSRIEEIENPFFGIEGSLEEKLKFAGSIFDKAKNL